jgi:hypothetical protein
MRAVAGAPFKANNVYVLHESRRGLSGRSKGWAEQVHPALGKTLRTFRAA